MKREKLTIVVVGGNAAGAAAAAKAKRVNPANDVLLFEQSNFISTGTCELPYVLSGEIVDIKEIVFFNAVTFEKEKQVQVFVNYKVTEILPRLNKITVFSITEKKSYEIAYDKLILATGSKAKRFPQFSSSIINVASLKNVDDAVKIKSWISASIHKSVVVIGSGFIGLETTEAIRSIGFNVYLIDISDLPLPVADKEIQQKIFSLLDSHGIAFLKTYEIEFLRKGDKITDIKIGEKVVPIAFVVTAIGFSPNTVLAEKAKLEIGRNGGIKVNSKLQTSHQNIYACGDCIEVKNFQTHSDEYLPLATLAQYQGHIAGENVSGGNLHSLPVVKNISVKVFEKFVSIVGLSESEIIQRGIAYNKVDAEIPNLVNVMKESSTVYGKILFDKSTNSILGASFVGEKEVSGYADLMSTYIQNSIPVTQLALTNYNYTPPLSPFINILSLLGRKATQTKKKS